MLQLAATFQPRPASEASFRSPQGWIGGLSDQVIADRGLSPKRSSSQTLAWAGTALLVLSAGVATLAPEAHATPPELDTDPFRPPPGQKAPAGKEPTRAARPSRFYARPTVGFVARFSPSRSFLPREGFGFSMEAGAVLGSGQLRFALGVAYEYLRVARSMDIYVGSTELTSCTEIRSASYHMALGQAVAWMDFAPVSLWVGLSGGFVHGAVRSPNPDCSSSETAVPHATLGPDFGVAYHLKPDLWLGLYLRSRHFFSHRRFVSPEGVEHPVYVPLLSTGLQVTLRF